MTQDAAKVDLQAVIEEAGSVLERIGEQLAGTIQEADRDCRAIGIAFRKLVDANRRNMALRCKGEAGETLRANCAEIEAAMSDAIVALQYQDLLSQRVFHIRSSLSQLQEGLCEGSSRPPAEWLELLQGVERRRQLQQQRLRRTELPADASVELF